METTLPSPQVEDSFDRSLWEQQRINSKEMAFRALLGRAVVVVIFLASPLIIYSLLPFYPPSLSIFVAVASAAISYRWPAIALFVLLLFAAPAYSYQLRFGDSLLALAIIGPLALVLPLSVARLPGAAVGCAVGAAAGTLMLTGSFLLSIPLLSGIGLIRLKGSTAGAGLGVFVFLAFYLPFLFLAADPAAPGGTVPQSGSVPVFLTVEHDKQPSLRHLSLSSIREAFPFLQEEDQDDPVTDDEIVPVGFGGVSSYFVDNWGGLALVLSMIIAFVATPALLNLTRATEETVLLVRRLAPLLALLAMEIMFLAPLQLLGGPLEYHTAFGSLGNVAALTAMMVAAGGVGFGIETWLIRRSLKVQLGSDLSILSRDLYGLLEDARERMRQMASVCRNKDLEDEKAAIAECEEKQALTIERIRTLGLTRLETSHKEFSNMRSQLLQLQLRLEAKLMNYLDDSRQTYETTVDGARALGIPVDPDGVQAGLPPVVGGTYEDAIEEHRRLNSAFRDLATKLVSAGDMLADTVKEEFDREFSLATIDIGHGFLEQERFEDAARTILEDLQIIDGRIESSIVDLADRITGMAIRSKDVVAHRLIPVFESIGDSDSLARCHGMVSELEGVAKSVEGSRTLADLIHIVEESRKLANMTTNTVNDLARKISALEVDNDRRCPPKYDWGKNIHATADVQQLLSSKESASSRLTISSRFSVIDVAVQTIEHQAKVVRQYSQVNESLINFHNMERTLKDKLSPKQGVASSDLPVKPKYAMDYLRMYAAKHHDEVAIDVKSGTLRLRSDKGTS